MKKRVLSTVMVIVTVIGVFAPCLSLPAGAETSGDWNYYVNDDGKTVTIANYNGAAENVKIPSKLDDKTVTRIGAGAFKEQSYPPNQTGVISVTIPKSVTDIMAYAFTNCASLTSVKFGSGVKRIESGAFFNCGFTSVTLPKSLKEIDGNAFFGCMKLKIIKVDKNNKNFSSKNGTLFNKDKTRLCIYPGGKTGDSYAIPDGVEIIGACAFDSCEKLVSITIPKSVTEIKGEAFRDCTGLTSASFKSKTPPKFDKDVFSGCGNLKTIYVPKGAKKDYQKVEELKGYTIKEK